MAHCWRNSTHNTIKACFCKGQGQGQGCSISSLSLAPMSTHIPPTFLHIHQQTYARWSKEHKLLGFLEMQVHSSLSPPPLHPSLLGTFSNIYKHLDTHTHIHTLMQLLQWDGGVGSHALCLGFPHPDWPSVPGDFPWRKPQFHKGRPHAGQPLRCHHHVP